VKRMAVIVAGTSIVAWIALVAWPRGTQARPAQTLQAAVEQPPAPQPPAWTQGWSVAASPPIPPQGLCGTEVAAPDDDTPNMQVPASLRALSARVPTVAQVKQAFEDFGLSDTEVIDLPTMANDALEDRQRREKELAEAPVPTGDTSEDRASNWVDRVDQLRALGKPDEVLKAAQEAHRLSSGFFPTERLVVALDEVNRPDEARRLLERSIPRTTEPSERAWLYEHLGYICSERGDSACADDAQRALGTIQESDGLTSFLRGTRQADQGNYEEAADAFSESIAVQRDFAALANLATVTSCMGKGEIARQLWLEAAESADGPEHQAGVLNGLGGAYLEDGDTASAWIAGSAALAAMGDRARASEARGLLALTALTMGDLDEAREQVRRSRKTNPYDDLVQGHWYSNPAQQASMRALVAETRGDTQAAKQAWLAVARSLDPKLSLAARHALSGLCPRS
jgi:tetratricopeptide (TPR) repeat protein